ncbi:MAG: hypothetical protein CL489_17765 [Acidobacteria bacterium]|nr:hypothetical protein [Acidobacteriota bacterium]
MFSIRQESKVTRGQLRSLPKPVKLGTRHCPVHHGELMDEIQRQVDKKFFLRNINGRMVPDIKLEVVGENLGVDTATRKDSVIESSELFGNLNMNVYRDKGSTLIDPLNGDMGFSLGIINSNSQKHRLTLFGGSIIFACENGMLTLDITGTTVKRKHTTHISIVEEVAKGLQAFCDSTRLIEVTATNMREKYLSSSDLNDALVRFGESGTMCWNLVGKTLADYRQREHQKLHGTNTVWSLYNAATNMIKGSSIAIQRKVMSGMQDDFDTIGLLPKPDLDEVHVTTLAPTLERVDN